MEFQEPLELFSYTRNIIKSLETINVKTSELHETPQGYSFLHPLGTTGDIRFFVTETHVTCCFEQQQITVSVRRGDIDHTLADLLRILTSLLTLLQTGKVKGFLS